MFYYYVLHDLVEIEPVYFPSSSPVPSSQGSSGSHHAATAAPATDPPYDLSMEDIVLHRLTERYVGRVIPQLGLCAAIAAVLSHSACEVKGLAGAAWVSCVFSVCVCAPRPGTLLQATVVAQGAEEGLVLEVLCFAVVGPAGASVRVEPSTLYALGGHFDSVQQQWQLPTSLRGDGAAAAAAAAGGSSFFSYAEGDALQVRVTQLKVHGDRHSSEAAKGTAAMAAEGGSGGAAGAMEVKATLLV